MQLVIDAQLTGLGGSGDGREASLRALSERFEEPHCVGGQAEPAAVRAAMRVPARGGDQQLLATTKREAMVDPDGAVAQRPAQAERGRHLERTERTLAIRAR